MHEKPAHPWTVDSLAREVGASRSVLAERFTHFVGQSPMQYLGRWRMALATNYLRRSSLNVARIAEEVGYETDAAVFPAAHSVASSEANGQAQIVYFGAMVVAAAALALFALFGYWWIPLPGIGGGSDFYGCIAAGALGAVVSVIQRINSGQFALTYDVGRPYVSFLGALRAVLGATFGLLLYFAVTSGLLTIFNVPAENTKRLFSFLVIAFLAGFSERWAQDTLTSLGQGSGQTDPAAGQPAAQAGHS